LSLLTQSDRSWTAYAWIAGVQLLQGVPLSSEQVTATLRGCNDRYPPCSESSMRLLRSHRAMRVILCKKPYLRERRWRPRYGCTWILNILILFKPLLLTGSHMYGKRLPTVVLATTLIKNYFLKLTICSMLSQPFLRAGPC